MTDNLCTKQENLGLKSAVHNQEQVMMARVRYSENREGFFARKMFYCSDNPGYDSLRKIRASQQIKVIDGSLEATSGQLWSEGCELGKL